MQMAYRYYDRDNDSQHRTKTVQDTSGNTSCYKKDVPVF